MARNAKSKIVKKLSAKARTIRSRAKSVPRKARAAVERKKSTLVKAARGTLSNARKAKSSVRGLRKKIARKLRKPNVRTSLSTDLKQLNAHLSVLQRDVVKLGQQAFDKQMKSFKKMGQSLRQIAAKRGR